MCIYLFIYFNAKTLNFLAGAFFELIASATNGQTICHENEKLQLVAKVV